ncbi:tape measure protein [Olsenella uli]|uniref:phage tail protein n=1 Tax=Olsenella uli TaxID=133926 RepID=UPI0028EF7BC1|nr:tape measure protein [Olsenella uli]
MADYTLSAEVTADVSGFTSGMERASSSMEEFRGKCRKASESAKSDMGDAASSTGSAWERMRDKAASVWSNIRSSVSSGVSGAWSAVRTNAAQMVGALGEVGSAGIAAVAGIAVQGGFERALAIDNAKKKLAGFGHDAADIASIMDSATTAVRGTAYGLGDAATTAATLSAAGVKSGEDMTRSLQAAANVAAASGRSFNDIGTIFSSVAARGKLMGDNMLQLTSSGVPVLQLLADHLHKTTAEVSDMVSKGQIDFQTFSDAMREGLGDAAQSSGDMLMGAAANVRAALSRMTEPLMTGVIQGAIGLFKQLAPAIDGISAALGSMMPALAPVVAGFAALAASGLAPVIASIPGVSALLSPLTGLLGAMGGPIGIAVAAFAGLVAVCPPLQEAFGGLFNAIGQLGGAFASLLGPAVEAALPVLSQFVQWVGQGLADAINAAAGFVSDLASRLQSMADGGASALAALQPMANWLTGTLVPALQGIGDYIVQTFGPAWDVLVQGFQDFAANVGPLITPVLEAAQAAFQQVGDAVNGSLVPALQAAQPVLEVVASVLAGSVGPALQMVASIVSTVLTTAFTVAGAVISGAMQAIGGVVQTVCGVIQAVVGALVGVFTGDWSMMASGASNVMGGLASTLAGIMNAIAGTIGGILNGIAGVFSDVWNGITGTVSGALSAVADTVGSMMGDAQSTVSGALSAISGLFSGAHFEFPRIALPHFSISGEFSLNPPSVPSLGIEWYAKGGILTRPTIFGARGGSLLGGGEAGPEAVLPIGRLVGFITRSLEDLGYGERDGGVTQNITQNVYEREDAYVAGAVLSRAALSAAMGV